MFTLWAVTLYLARNKRLYAVALLPAMFMTVVCTTYILGAPRPEGFGLDVPLAIMLGIGVAMAFAVLFFAYKRKLEPDLEPGLSE